MMFKYADERQKKLHTKFPTTHYLSNPNNVDHVFLWNTFFRRNLHRLAIDYLKINLHLYQAIMLYFMGICQFIVVIACRAAAKSFIIALYACCRCITRPFTKIVLSSSTKGQSKLIVSEKIKNELMNMSPALKLEIKSIKDNQNEVIVFFRNGSTITVVPASENGRGFRSHCCIREEFRQIEKQVDDSILSPFQTVRQAPYMLIEFYSSMKELQEEPVDIYISSSWVDNGHWMWDIVDQSCKDMLNGEHSCLFAFDESITLRHNIRTMRQMQKEKKKQDPLTWRIEYLNERVKENTQAYFSFDIINQNQRLQRAFYPRKNLDYLSKLKNKYAIPKQDGEYRVISCDIAMMDNKANDNSVYSCLRLLPENISSENKNGYYRIQVPYIESHRGGETSKQAIRIKQLFEDFNADFVVLDTRNAGISIYDALAKILYDDERDVEYKPWTCMNNDDIAKRIKNPSAAPVVYAINANLKLNSDIAINMRSTLVEKKIDFLLNYRDGVDEIQKRIPEYNISLSPEDQLYYETPYLETMFLVNEMISLEYEKMPQTGYIKIQEQGNNMKDRYTSVSYGAFFCAELERDLFKEVKSDFSNAPNCVSTFSY